MHGGTSGSGPKRFGDQLREWRVAAKKTMGQVARALDVTVVYYSDIENGRKPPFPFRDRYYEALAREFGVPALRIVNAAMLERRRVEINIENKPREVQRAAIVFARLVEDETIDKEKLAAILQLLGQKDEED